METSDPIVEKVLTAIARVKHVPRESVSQEQSLAELGFDSLDTISLLFELEETFKVTIPDEEARTIRTIPDVVAGIRTLMARATGRSSSESAA